MWISQAVDIRRACETAFVGNDLAAGGAVEGAETFARQARDGAAAATTAAGPGAGKRRGLFRHLQEPVNHLPRTHGSAPRARKAD